MPRFPQQVIGAEGICSPTVVQGDFTRIAIWVSAFFANQS